MVTKIPRPDLSKRPLEATCECLIQAKPGEVYAAWTESFDSWFAQAGTVSMVAEAGRPYFFYTPDDWGRHPHYGRFLELVPDRLIEMTWVTGDGTSEGTGGAESIVRIELTPEGEATRLRLTHSGLPTEKSRDGHQENWPLALQELAEALS